MSYAGWHIKELKFTGQGDAEAHLSFSSGLSLVYGASNTGKSFALKALNFMLGGGALLPLIKEREPYNKAWLEIAFSPEHRAVLQRALAGGSFLLQEGDSQLRTLGPKHDANSTANIS